MGKARRQRDVLQESMRMLGRKEYSVKGMREALLKKGYAIIEAEQSIKQLMEWGYLTDERFAEERILHFRGARKGRIFTEYSLAEQGVPREKARELLEMFYPEEEEIAIACRLTSERFSHREDSQEERMRWRRSLATSGFSRKAIEACGYRDEET